MKHMSFEETVLATLRQVPERQRAFVLNILRALVRELKGPGSGDGKKQYSVKRHQEIRRLTGTIRGNLAAVISAERDLRG